MSKVQKLDLSDLWYIIGYIATDGNLSKDGRHIDITSKDRAHLYKIRKALGLKLKIGRKARGGESLKKYSTLQIGNVKFYHFLLTLGLSPRKSLTLSAIKVNRRFVNDFLRGVIDGDGNISTWIHKTNLCRQWRLRIYSASPEFILWLNKTIEEEFGFVGVIHYPTSGKGKVCRLHFGKTKASLILKYIYYKDCLSLDRKRDAASRLCLADSAILM